MLIPWNWFPLFLSLTFKQTPLEGLGHPPPHVSPCSHPHVGMLISQLEFMPTWHCSQANENVADLPEAQSTVVENYIRRVLRGAARTWCWTSVETVNEEHKSEKGAIYCSKALDLSVSALDSPSMIWSLAANHFLPSKMWGGEGGWKEWKSKLGSAIC